MPRVSIGYVALVICSSFLNEPALWAAAKKAAIKHDTAAGMVERVVCTTVRPAKPLVCLQIGDESIIATGGHRFWVTSEGWTKARDLKPQSLVHTVTGNAPIHSVATGPAAETYNLVIADFHDYFVGRSGFLVQDLPMPQPTNIIVPGLSRAVAVVPTRK